MCIINRKCLYGGYYNHICNYLSDDKHEKRKKKNMLQVFKYRTRKNVIPLLRCPFTNGAQNVARDRTYSSVSCARSVFFLYGNYREKLLFMIVLLLLLLYFYGVCMCEMILPQIIIHLKHKFINIRDVFVHNGRRIERIIFI